MRQRRRNMQAIRGRDTTPEMLVRRIVHRLGYRYRLHVRSLPGTPDIVLPRHRKVIEVRGCFWHMHPCGRCRIPATRRAWWRAKLLRNAERDRSSERKLRRLGWGVMVIWECQLRDAARVERRIRRFLEG